MTPPMVVYTFGTPISLILERNFIDWVASRNRGIFDLPDDPVCPDCRCLLDPPAHSPRCKA